MICGFKYIIDKVTPIQLLNFQHYALVIITNFTIMISRKSFYQIKNPNVEKRNEEEI